MKLKILSFSFFSIIIIFLILSIFFGDTIIFYIASMNDKLYGADNRYIDATLSEPQLSHSSNVKDSYKFQDNMNDWALKLIDWLGVVLKIFGIFLLPLFLYLYFISKDKGIFQFFDNLFNKKE